ncbi:MAG: ComEC/Rec2 family competence protein [Candidatus Saccharimonadales bacterium]
MFNSWRYRKFHSSYVVGWMCAGLLVGLALAQVMVVAWSWWLAGMVLIIMAGSFVRARWYAIVLGVCAAIVIGAMRGDAIHQLLRSTEQLASHSVTLAGAIAEDPQVTANGLTRVVLHELRDEHTHYAGSAWLTIRGEKTFRRGDKLVVSGNAKPGFGVYQLSMSATVLDHKKGNDPMLNLRDDFSRAIKQSIVEPSASLGIGFVVGQKTSLPPQLDEQLRIVGLTHLVVASGYNLTILVRFAKRLFEKRSKFLVAFSSSILIVGFVAISGASPSMVRASIVAGLSIAAWYYGRRFHPLLLIVYVAALTAMIDPLYLWADIGWWLSFLAFAGVLIVSPLLTRMIMRQRTTPALLQIVFETTAAQIMTLPLILMVFGNLPVLALVANVLSAPLIPLAMLLTFIAGVTTMVLPALGFIAALPAEILLSYFVAIVRHLSQPEWAQLPVSITPAVMVVLYGAVAGFFIVAWRRLRYNFRAQSLVD